jgi:hypothetical protein
VTRRSSPVARRFEPLEATGDLGKNRQEVNRHIADVAHNLSGVGRVVVGVDCRTHRPGRAASGPMGTCRESRLSGDHRHLTGRLARGHH